MTANGPAIKGGCVTRRSIRAGSWYFSQKFVTVQGGYGAVFGVMVQIFGPIRVSRYNADRKQVSCHLIVILLTALAQSRVTILDGVRSESWYRILIAIT